MTKKLSADFTGTADQTEQGALVGQTLMPDASYTRAITTHNRLVAVVESQTGINAIDPRAVSFNVTEDYFSAGGERVIDAKMTIGETSHDVTAIPAVTLQLRTEQNLQPFFPDDNPATWAQPKAKVA